MDIFLVDPQCGIDMENVILVNDQDEEIGQLEKLSAHKQGLLHRAFSIFIFNSNQELLLHKRADGKYHSPGLWTNTCCSHPRPGEKTIDAANRRLMEEMGMHCDLKHAFSFTYRAELDQGLTEHEFDHVFIGVSNDSPKPNPEEVSDWKYLPMTAIQSEINTHPQNFTEWFKICLESYLDRFPI